MTTANRLILWLAFILACFLPPSAFTPTAPENCVWEIFSTWYDAAATEANSTYDRSAASTLTYDTTPIHGATTEAKSTEANRTLFGQNAEFKAAEETPQLVQMEFPFARGAAIQTPGVTAEGETFVRVGAAPYNLKFGSTSLSGAQPGTYAFPQATFDAIGQNPAALKNFGDLP